MPYFLQVSSHNIKICLTDMPPCKIEHDQMETCHIVIINKSLLGAEANARRTVKCPHHGITFKLHNSTFWLLTSFLFCGFLREIKESKIIY